MLFPESRPDVIQAINQRWLLNFWNRHLGEHRVPRWQAVEAENLTRMSDNFSFLDVTGGERGDRLLAAFEFIAPDGAFDQRDLLTLRTAPPALRISATIAPQASA